VYLSFAHRAADTRDPRRRLVLPPSAVAARCGEEDATTPHGGSWTARAAAFLRQEAFLSSESLSRRLPRMGGGGKAADASDAGAPGAGLVRRARDAARAVAGARGGSPARRQRRRGGGGASGSPRQSPQRRARERAEGAPAAPGSAEPGQPGCAPGAEDAVAEPETRDAPSGPSNGVHHPGADEHAAAPSHDGEAAPDGAGGDGGKSGSPPRGGAQEAWRRLQVKVGGAARGQGGALKSWTPASWWRGAAPSAWQARTASAWQHSASSPDCCKL